MFRLVAVLTLSTAMMAQSAPGDAPEPQLLPPSKAQSVPSVSAKLPAPPRGKSTVMGGQVRDLDPIRDQFELKVYGGKSVKMLFDERTQAYRDGKKISVLDISRDDQASVETTLDGSEIFALRIHILSQLPEGECRGQVVRFDPASGNLKIDVVSTHEQLVFRVPAGAPMEGVGQQASLSQQGGRGALVRGSLVDVKFNGGKGGNGVATHVAVLAVPGSTFVIGGSLSFLDMQAGRLVIVDSRDNHSYDVAFAPSQFSVSPKLRVGMTIQATTVFDGAHYLARQISVVAQ